MDEKQCEIYRERIDERLNTHDKRLDSHSERIKELENHRSATDVRIDNLIKTIEDLVEQTKWLKRCVTGAVIGAIVTLVVKFVVER